MLFKNNQGNVYFEKEGSKNLEPVEILKAFISDRFGEDRTENLLVSKKVFIDV